MTYDQRNCKDFLMANSRKFGITETNLRTESLDICVKNVRCIASRRIDEKIVLPSMSNFINSCTGLVDCAGGIDTQFASLRVTHAKEELVDCDTNCPGVKVIIKGQIIVRTKNCNPCVAPSYMAIPVELCSETIRDFYYASSGEKVAQLKSELPYIEGSCMVINLSCRVYREVCNGYSRYVAHVRGSVVDKLWKTENIWVEGVRPYASPSITVCDRFERDISTAMDEGECTATGAQCVMEEESCENGCSACSGGYSCGINGCTNYGYCGCNGCCGCGTTYNSCGCGTSAYNGCGCTANNCGECYTAGCGCYNGDCGCYTNSTADEDDTCDCE